jgi:hypothetical protein
VLIFEILVELFIEVFGSLFLETLFATTHALDEDKGAKAPAAFLLLLVGVVMGVVTVVVVPTRLFPSRFFQGESLLVAPFVVALAMEAWGRLRTKRERNVSHLGTWYGGAALGIGYAAGRLVALAFAQDVATL